MKLLRGIVTAMLTPFTQDGGVDVPALNRLTDYLIDRGVDCLYPTGSVGEMLRMTAEERNAVAEAVVSQAAGRVPVYVHVGAVSTRETVALAQHAQRIGADGVGVVTPAYFPLPERDVEAFYDDVASSVDLPLYLYAIPQYAVNDISPGLAARLHARHRNVVGIKSSVAEPSRLLSYTAIAGMEVLQGLDRLALPSLCMRGVSGVVSGGSSACPEPYVAVRRAIERGDLEAARQADALLQAYASAIGFGSIALEKEFLALRGLPVGAPRKPALPPTEEQLAALREIYPQLNERCAGLAG